MIPPPTFYATTVQWMAWPLAVWCVLSSLELLAVRRAFAPGRPLGPDLIGLARRRVTPALLPPPALPALTALRLAAGLVLPFSGNAIGAPLIVILGCTAWLAIATGGGDGADKIALVAGTATLLIATGRTLDDRWLCLAGIVWGAGQVTIAYVTSGAAKLARGFWRDGSALAAAMTSHRSGHRFAARIVRHRPAARVLAWGVMLVEVLFPLALVTPQPFCIAILAMLAAFHVATAIVMGLNTYPWAFIATYPCIMAANAIIVGS